jgi:hypothetical protein
VLFVFKVEKVLLQAAELCRFKHQIRELLVQVGFSSSVREVPVVVIVVRLILEPVPPLLVVEACFSCLLEVVQAALEAPCKAMRVEALSIQAEAFFFPVAKAQHRVAEG